MSVIVVGSGTRVRVKAAEYALLTMPGLVNRATISAALWPGKSALNLPINGVEPVAALPMYPIPRTSKDADPGLRLNAERPDGLFVVPMRGPMMGVQKVTPAQVVEGVPAPRGMNCRSRNIVGAAANVIQAGKLKAVFSGWPPVSLMF